jgi:CRP/FNR family transcriptional regulator, anaerobic regulatory protein
MIAPSACAECPVKDHAVCAALSDDKRRDLASLGHHKSYDRGQTIFAAGETVWKCATLIEGVLKVRQIDRDGNEQIISLIHPSGFVGELFAGVTENDIVALTPAKLCLFERTHYEAALVRYPELSAALLRRSIRDTQEVRALFAASGRKTSIERLASLLILLSSAAGPAPCEPSLSFDSCLSRADMASVLGLTIETVSRQFSKLEKEGLIKRVGHRRLEIVNHGGLLSLAGHG